MVPVTAFFGGILGFMYIGLTVYVIKRRSGLGLPMGDGGDAIIARRIRAHANFAENVPIALILMGINEINGRSAWLLTVLGLALVAARVSHAYSLLEVEAKDARQIGYRKTGMTVTLSVIGILAFLAIV